jgi:transposase
VERRAYRQTVVATVPPQALVFVDETGVTIAMERRYARALGGSRAHVAAPKAWRDTVSVIGAITVAGDLSATMSMRGSVDGDVFRVYLREVLGPRLRPGQVVVMDNLSVHKVAGVRATIEARGARLVYLPRYSPDLNPIEACWSKVKTVLRTLAARTYDALDAALTTAVAAVTPADAAGWFQHCGYQAT